MRRFDVKLDYVASERLFRQRLENPGIRIAPGFEANFFEPSNPDEERIKGLIDEYRSRTIPGVEQELFEEKSRLTLAERKLASLKPTKAASESKRIATKNIARCIKKLSDLKRTEWQPDDDRIFSMNYAGVIIQQGPTKLLTPMRYYCRPAGQPSFLDKKLKGLYNARRDSLLDFWKDHFGQDHAIAVIDSFYEHVKRHDLEGRALKDGEAPENVVLHFEPQPHDPMLVACIWSHWTDPTEPELRSFAIITDDPPPEIEAAGHNRCPINIQEKNVDAWLTPQGRSVDELQTILTDKQQPYYEHEIEKAA